MFQNIYPVFEPKRLLKKEMLENMGEETVLSKMLKNAPDRQMSARIDELMGNALVNGSMADSREEVEAMNLDSIADFYRQIYTNPNGLVCVACGNFDMAEVEYVPGSGKTE